MVREKVDVLLPLGTRGPYRRVVAGRLPIRPPPSPPTLLPALPSLPSACFTLLTLRPLYPPYPLPALPSLTSDGLLKVGVGMNDENPELCK